jgi:hypothetical protein
MIRVGFEGKRRGSFWMAALCALGFLLGAPEVRAGDEFEDGFKDELGRLAAHEAVVVGRGVLAGILLGGHPGYYPPPAYPTHRPHYYDDYPRHHYHHHYYYPRRHYGYGHWNGHHHHGWGHHRHHHRHHGCDH